MCSSHVLCCLVFLCLVPHGLSFHGFNNKYGSIAYRRNVFLLRDTSRETKQCLSEKMQHKQSLSFFKPTMAIKSADSYLKSSSKDTGTSSILSNYNGLVYKPQHLFQFAILVSAISGLLTAHGVLNLRKCIAFLQVNILKQWPTSLSFLVTSITLTLFYFINSSSLSLTFPSYSAKYLLDTSTNFYKRLVVRLLGIIVTVGGGYSTGPAGVAGELGMVITRLMTLTFLVPFLRFFQNNKQNSQQTDHGELLVLNEKELLLLLTRCMIAGAAAGVATNFNAPLLGIFFACEITRRLIPASAAANASTFHSKKTLIEHIFNEDNLLIVIAVFFATFVYRKPSLFFTGSATPVFQMPAMFYTHSFQHDLSMKIGEMLLLLPLSVLCGTLCRYYFQWRQSLLATRDTLLKINNPFPQENVNLRKAFQFVQRWVVGCGLLAVVTYGATQLQVMPQLPLALQHIKRVLLLSAEADKKTFTLGTVLMIAMCRAVLINLSAVSPSLVGGHFTPTFLVGAAAGHVYHRLLSLVSQKLIHHQLVSQSVAQVLSALLQTPALCVLAAGGAAVTCQMRAPLAATAFLVEMTQTYAMTPLWFVITSLATSVCDRKMGDTKKKAKGNYNTNNNSNNSNTKDDDKTPVAIDNNSKK